MRISVEQGYKNALASLPPERAKKANAALLKFQNNPRLRSRDFRQLKSNPGYFIIDPHRGDRVS
jgi:hypothetical protein